MAANTRKRTARKPAGGAKRSARARPPRRVAVFVATRKGAWLYHGDAARKAWRADGPHFLGHIVSHVVLDPRDGRTLLATAKTGHLGPTVFRSTDLGRSWKEAARPPAFAKAPEGEKGRAVAESNDGFFLAEKDLNLRGPGEFLGTRQSGYASSLRMASLTDVKLIEKACLQAQSVFDKDPDLSQPENTLLAEALGRFWGEGKGDVS